MIHAHPLLIPSNSADSSNPESKPNTPLINHVLSHLRHPSHFNTPNGLALYRRLQFGRFLESSYLYTNLELSLGIDPDGGLERGSEGLSGEEANGVRAKEEEEPWFYAFVDRGCRPETEVWFFGSWEAIHDCEEGDGWIERNDVPSPSKEPQQQRLDDNDSAIRTLLGGFLQAIKTHPLPPSIHNPSDVLLAQSQIAGGKYQNHNDTTTITNKTHPLNPTTLLLGALSAPTTQHLHHLNLLATDLLPPHPNHTFLFHLSRLPPQPALPPNLRWEKLQHQHYALVRSRTEIARQDYTLARLPGVAIFPASSAEEAGADGAGGEDAQAAPVAWAFAGLDGSLTSLHVEASHRRMGLGKVMTGKLLREEMGRFFGEDEEEMGKVAHGNVMVGNEASKGMCESLGGRDVGEVYWVRVDLEML